jgi:hypothetical protein
VDAFADKVTLAESKTSTDWGASARCPLRIESVDIKRQMYRGVVANVCKSHLDNTANSMPDEQFGIAQELLHVIKYRDPRDLPVDIVHAESFDTVLSENLLLSSIDITQPNIYQLIQIQPVFAL